MKTHTRLTATIMTTFILALMVSGTPLAFASAPTSTPSKTAPEVPTALISYVEQHPGTYGCVSGTLVPFTITSTTCPASTNNIRDGLSMKTTSMTTQRVGPVPDSTYSITCTGVCLAGTDNSGSTYYTLWDAFAYVPTLPSSTYSSSPYVLEWMGLATCVPSCSGYLVQGGNAYGVDGSSNSQNPSVFVEYVSSSGTCSTSFCGNYISSATGDDDNWEMNYLSASSQWLLYGQDYTKSTYTTYYIPVGGSGNMPYSSLHYGLTAVEGGAANSASDWPGTVTFTSVVGEDTSRNYQLGTQGTNFAGPSGSSLTASISYSTSSCYAGTCASIALGVT